MKPLINFDVKKIRDDFPLLKEQSRAHPLVYLDNAATTQKPRQVIDAISRYYEENNANIHRGIHFLSEQATQAFEAVRIKVQHFINAKEVREIIFVRGTTEAINLVANSYGRSHLQQGDEILITEMEHHSNIVPWQLIASQVGAILRVVSVKDDGTLDLNEFQQALNPRTKLVALTHVSNVLGTINPIQAIVDMAHAVDVPVLVDGAQAVCHMPVDVQQLGCDFYAFSGHKLLGPTGIGVLYGKAELLSAMPPYHGGGEMVGVVTFDKTTYRDIPHKFEAGTPDIAGVVGLGAAIDYLTSIGLDPIMEYEHALLCYATEAIAATPGLRFIGNPPEKSAILTFILEGIHAHDVATILDNQGIAVRAGHHCAMPLMARFQVPATVRASLAFYNTYQEIDRLAEGLLQVNEVFK